MKLVLVAATAASLPLPLTEPHRITRPQPTSEVINMEAIDWQRRSTFSAVNFKTLHPIMERCQTVKGQFGECYLADGRIHFLDIFRSWSFARMFYHLTNIYCTIWTNGRILFYHSTMCPSYAQSLDKWKSSTGWSIWSDSGLVDFDL